MAKWLGNKSWIWRGLKGLFVLILIGLVCAGLSFKTPSLEVRSSSPCRSVGSVCAHYFENPTDMVDDDLWVNLQDFYGGQNRVPWSVPHTVHALE